MQFIAISMFIVLAQFFELNAREVRRDDQWPPPKLITALKPVHEKCQKMIGISEEAITEYDLGEDHEGNRLIHCYMSCMFREFDVVHENGDPHLEKIESHFVDVTGELKIAADNLLAACRNIHGNDDCERAFSIHKCWKLYDPKHYFLP